MSRKDRLTKILEDFKKEMEVKMGNIPKGKGQLLKPIERKVVLFYGKPIKEDIYKVNEQFFIVHNGTKVNVFQVANAEKYSTYNFR